MIVCTQQKWFIREHTLPCDVLGLHHWTIWELSLFAKSKTLLTTLSHYKATYCNFCTDTTWVIPVIIIIIISSSWDVQQLSALPYMDTFTPQWTDSPPPSLHGGIRVFQSPSTLLYLLLIKLLIQFGPLCHEGGQASGAGITKSLWCGTLYRTLLVALL